jgi:hypothetical protein
VIHDAGNLDFSSSILRPIYCVLSYRLRKAFELKLFEEISQVSTGFLDTLISSLSDGVIVYDGKNIKIGLLLYPTVHIIKGSKA